MSEHALPSDAEITFRRISALTVCEVCELSETLSEGQRNMVADNGTSIAEAHFSENAWFRAIYAEETLVGFIMLHQGSDWDDGIDCPGVYLWRFMIARPFQGKGIGKKAIELVVRDLKARGIRELYTSYGLGEASPEGFYKGLGFVLTGDSYGEEPEAVLKFAA
ncbi:MULTISPECIES: GNAT family N-acetyltransferase [unclassified Ensifer]|jgi:diamine N-acetyltransferase|uniref:GNAT family N-acetyltransferase n=1 Tax=unclassified Ensifer TaxID=2633371 RepID=UPI00046CAE90|nr:MULTISPECIES: GNAT family N-acetyltransferase [unclassified Ensifer]MDP9629877.1 diamine N-acetyltransferase [Ensifer adhaerens]KQW49842.1 acetyltransferase [Ensifer sp. Root1252]KRC57631.1 acetyltransferase [Ensifer sp. Root231]KRD00279.1 acetyltransferase [Ensifer sp. Root258]MBD9490601.1 GNAT family N-acetyltransferase [Ensifer sp. ENS11]